MGTGTGSTITAGPSVCESMSQTLGLQEVPLFWLKGLHSKALFFRIRGGGAEGFTLSVCVLAVFPELFVAAAGREACKTLFPKTVGCPLDAFTSEITLAMTGVVSLVVGDTRLTVL